MRSGSWLDASLLFFLALLPRAFGLNVFLTADELLWIERSAGFLAAIMSGAWAETFQVGHPGVITRWTGLLGILASYWPHLQAKAGELWLDTVTFETFLQRHPERMAKLAIAVRLPTVLLVSFCVVAAYFLLRRLFGRQVALLAAVLLALDPFYLALSRVIHHDALSASFMLLSVLAFMVYLREERYVFLAASGLAAGLAFLSKSPSLFLVPFTGLMSLFAWWERKGRLQSCSNDLSRYYQALFRLSRNWAIWGLVGLVVCFVLWPSMWVAPWNTVLGVWDKATGYAAAPHERSNFFMGRVQPDPGPLFYPVAVLFRLTPLTLLGLAAFFLPVRLLIRDKNESGTGPTLPGGYLASLWGFVVLYLMFMTTGAKKFDRYSLPVFPMLDILAAAGLSNLFRVACSRVKFIATEGTEFTEVKAKSLRALCVLCVLCGSIAFALPHYPYYLTYYNPLLGGIQGAAKVLLVGWGEGYEAAAAYLNQKEDASQLKVATWYAKTIFAPLFRGQSYKLSVDSQEPIGVVPWYETDYVVFYLNQVQRLIPSVGTVDFFLARQPEYTVRLAGLDYAWVYEVPTEVPLEAYPYQRPTTVDFGGAIRLLGYDVESQLFVWGEQRYLDLTLYWQSLRPVAEDYRVYLEMLDGDGHVRSESDTYPVFDGFHTSQWETGVILRDRRGVEIPPDIQPGIYRVSVQLFDPDSNKSLKPDGEEDLMLGVRVLIRPGGREIELEWGEEG